MVEGYLPVRFVKFRIRHVPFRFAETTVSRLDFDDRQRFSEFRRRDTRISGFTRSAILTDGHLPLTVNSPMFRLSSTHRIVLGLVALTVSALLVCGMLGLIPGIQQTESISRQGFCETTAVSFMALAPRMDQDSPEQTLEQLKERRSDVQSVGVRRADGEIVISSANHVDLWESTGDNPANECEFIVPIGVRHKPVFADFL